MAGALYYQHIGEALWARDSSRSIGTPSQGLRHFQPEHFGDWLTGIEQFEVDSAAATAKVIAPEGFQVWGLPDGAQIAVKNMTKGDCLLLLESAHFRFVGEIIHRFTARCPDFSKKMWGEEKFPIIVWLKGRLINYFWDEFVNDFCFD